jgi:membrane protein required for beta-lactamase induction
VLLWLLLLGTLLLLLYDLLLCVLLLLLLLHLLATVTRSWCLGPADVVRDPVAASHCPYTTKHISAAHMASGVCMPCFNNYPMNKSPSD